VIDFYFQSQVLSKYVALANAISLGIISILRITCILLQASLLAFVFLTLLNNILLALGLVFFYKRRNLAVSSWKFDKQIAKQLLKDSWPLILSGMVVAVYMKIDQVMIKEMLDNNAVGQYAAAVRISEAWYFVPTIICSSLFPAIINAKRGSEELYYLRLQRLFNLMVALGIGVALPMTFLSNAIVGVLYGQAYSQTANVLMIHIWAGVFVGLGVASSKWYLTENLQTLVFWRSFWGAITNICLNLVLIPTSGIKGAAVATLLSQLVASMLFDCFNKKTRHVFIMKIYSFSFSLFLNTRKE
jgi:O-antigen/teichoic acid export membrane protein